MQEFKRRPHMQHWFETKQGQGIESELDISREQNF